MKNKRFAVVRGRLPFPIDMLRYDQCYPAEERDSRSITESIEGLLESDKEISIGIVYSSGAGLNRSRWESFGWTFHINDYNLSRIEEYNRGKNI